MSAHLSACGAIQYGQVAEELLLAAILTILDVKRIHMNHIASPCKVEAFQQGASAS